MNISGFRLTVILCLGIFAFTRKAEGQVHGRLGPRECQGDKVNWRPMEKEADKCLSMAPAGTVDTCIKLCALHNYGILVNGIVSEAGLDYYVEETYAFYVWARMKKAIIACTNRYIEDSKDAVCLRSARYIDCFDDAQSNICMEDRPIVIPPPPPPPPPAVRIHHQQQVRFQPPPPPPQQQGLLGGVLGTATGLIGSILG